MAFLAAVDVSSTVGSSSSSRESSDVAISKKRVMFPDEKDLVTARYALDRGILHRSARSAWFGDITAYKGKIGFLSVQGKEYFALIPRKLLNNGYFLSDYAVLLDNPDEEVEVVEENGKRIGPLYYEFEDSEKTHFRFWDFPPGVPSIELLDEVKVVFPDGSSKLSYLCVPVSRLVEKFLRSSPHLNLKHAVNHIRSNYPLPVKLFLVDPDTVPSECVSYDDLLRFFYSTGASFAPSATEVSLTGVKRERTDGGAEAGAGALAEVALDQNQGDPKRARKDATVCLDHMVSGADASAALVLDSGI